MKAGDEANYMILQDLDNAKLIHPPKWLISNTHYLCYMGSVAYGVSQDFSDTDVYGWCIPNKEIIFPHLAGEILGFGTQINRFEQWQEHGIFFKEKKYDFQVYNIVKYFHLCMENNPNMIDSMFVPRNCIFHITELAERVREKRKIFLHKGIYHKLKGYAYSQLKKMKVKGENKTRRQELIDQQGFDTKFAYHLVRLIDECKQVLIEHDLDLMRNKERLGAIRNGEWTEEKVIQYFTDGELELERLYTESTLQHSPDESKIKQLLLECLEIHFGSLDKCITQIGKYETAIRQIQDIVGKL